MKWYKKFFVNGQEYYFDGESVSILENFEDIESKKLQYNPLNSQRTSTLKTLCLVLNNSCNLSCEYCFANKGKYDKPNEKMSFFTAKKAIDHLIQTARENENTNITISFFGGEPLLSFEMIKQCVSYIKQFEDIKPEYMITTNGTLLTADVVSFLEENSFDIMISIDGNQVIHDFYRKYSSGRGSYTTVADGIKLFSNPGTINARITVSNHNPEIHTYIDDILKLGIRRITFAVDYNISETSFQLFIESIKKLFEKYYNDIVNGYYYDITNFSSIITSLVLHQRRLTFCNAGISYLTVSADGQYYRCPRFVGKKEYKISTVDETAKVNEEMKKFVETLKNSPGERNVECQKCVYSYICGGMCYHHAVMAGKTQFENVSRECYQRKMIFDGIVELICKLSPENRRELLLYYTKLWNTLKGGACV